MVMETLNKPIEDYSGTLCHKSPFCVLLSMILATRPCVLKHSIQ